MSENLPITWEPMSDEDEAQLEARATLADMTLSQSVIAAVESGDPEAPVWTPEPGHNFDLPLLHLLAEQISEDIDDPILPGLIKLWGLALKATDPAIRLQAQATLAEFQRLHCYRHGKGAFEFVQLEDEQ
jgi:hypothetical protein